MERSSRCEDIKMRPRIAIFSGPTATIHNSPPLVTSNTARARAGLPPLRSHGGTQPQYDSLRPQRLAAPVTVYIEQFSAHPLESDAAELYGPPDGYLDREGRLHHERKAPEDTPVYQVTLRPEDGLYPLPYMALQSNGQPWDTDGASPLAPAERSRQPFYPDASRIFEEIDRFGIGEDGQNEILARLADYDFYRAAPPGGYKRGLLANQRTDVGEGDIPPEKLGQDFFPYRPRHLRVEPPSHVLARLTNCVQGALGTGHFDGAIWLEGSPSLEETIYWLNLVIDTTVPIVGNAAVRTHGSVGNDGDRNIIDSVRYIVSRIWADDDGRNRLGAVVIQDEQIFTSREVQKGDARPGGYLATGGHGGIVGSVRPPGSPLLTFVPVRRHTCTSQVRLSILPESVSVVRRDGASTVVTRISTREASGALLPNAIPKVSLVKDGRFSPDDVVADPATEVDVLARIEQALERGALAGFVVEAGVPYGSVGVPLHAAIGRAAFLGMPTVLVSRGNAEGYVTLRPGELAIAGSNLTATKARLLLMACLLRFGSLPVAADPDNPGRDEEEAVRAKLGEYQEVFDTH